jgi:hypothetical protein
MRDFPHNGLGFSLISHQVKQDGQPFQCVDCHPDEYTSHTCDTCHGQIDATFIDQHIFEYGSECLGCHDGVETLGADFDHAETRFPLTGGHIESLCAECHANPRTRADFQSTPTTCVDCHAEDEPHGGRFGQDCASCHTADAWSPAEFDHDLAHFKLTGEHVEVACSSCHRNGVLAGTPMDCASCHADDDPHGEVYGTACEDCHTPDDWEEVSFDHSQTGFSLTGAHVSATCESCHAETPLSEMSTTCGACHTGDDAHGGQLGSDCASCHTTSAWKPSTFNHSRSSFPLTGAHASATCASCHPGGRFARTPSTCGACHASDDAHGGQLGLNCGSCHSTTAWKPSTFDHSRSSFALTGAHTSASCASCHPGGRFAGTSSSCASCHGSDDPHGGQFGSNCASCHTTSAWKPSTFDHSRTGFALTGAHASASCAGCHPGGRFAGTPSSCASCHGSDDPHGGRFGSDCAACHSTNAWRPATFDHSLSGFPLTGAHASTSCTSCHPGGRFSGTSSACASCHGEPAYHAGVFGTNCGSCHNTNNWSATYNGSHPSIHGEDGRNHEGATCRDCHTQTLASATCLKCHDSNNPEEEEEEEEDTSSSNLGGFSDQEMATAFSWFLGNR